MKTHIPLFWLFIFLKNTHNTAKLLEMMKKITICLFLNLFLFSFSFAGMAQIKLWEPSHFHTPIPPYSHTHFGQELNVFEPNWNAQSKLPRKFTWKFQELDRRLLAMVESQNRYPVLDYTLETVSLISPFIEGGLTLERCLRGYIKQDESMKNIGIIAAAALIGTQIVNIVLKYAIARDRPDPGARSYRPRLFNTRLTHSFPSGHTASSFAFAKVMEAKYPKHKIPLLGYAALSGYSQMYVGNHYPSDVFAGAILGYGVGEVTLDYEIVIIRTFF